MILSYCLKYRKNTKSKHRSNPLVKKFYDQYQKIKICYRTRGKYATTELF